jgi:hypothetical protein
MLNIIAFLESPTTWLISTFGIIVGLVGVIFNSMNVRVSKLETEHEGMVPVVARIDANVANIQKHCSYCPDEK